MDRLEAEIRAHGMNVFDRIDHAAGAPEAGVELRPTELIIFGNARGGTPLMQSVQTTRRSQRRTGREQNEQRAQRDVGSGCGHSVKAPLTNEDAG